MAFYLDADDDYIEVLRRWLWPKLHPYITPYGLYAIGTVSDDQHVATLDVSEGEIEQVLTDVGFLRNPIACYKETDGGRKSEGSWALLAHHDPLGELESDEQLHITLFDPDDGDGVDVYAHAEYDWRDRPIDHLDESYFSTRDGVTYMTQLLESETDLLD